MGQTPPPWHGQAVATQLLFDHDWPDFEIHRLRMEFSEEMLEVGRFQWKKIRHLFQLIIKARAILRQHADCVLFYPPASAKWIPFIRDVIFLTLVRPHAGSTVFIFHASGLPTFVKSGPVRRLLGKLAYSGADVSLEVAQEEHPPHVAFNAGAWRWCPCAIDVPRLERIQRKRDSPLRVLFVGSLQEGKGVLEILRTASVLKQQGMQADFQFRIVGKWFSEDFEIQARQLHSELELDGIVDFAGQLTGESKWQAYSDSDVFFFPTHYASEATPIVLMEALGMGLPVISTQWAGIPAMLRGCASARLLPVRAPSQYAEALLELRACMNQATAVEAVSRQFYRENFLPMRFIERVEEAMRTAACQSGRKQDATNGACGESTNGFHATVPQHVQSPPLGVSAYLADQNPGFDRSFGISRMSQVILEALQSTSAVEIEAISSKTSQQAPDGIRTAHILPWGTRRKWVRLLTDHFHPLFSGRGPAPDLHYFPKGYLPLLNGFCTPSVVTIHDTIIQYDEDHYPNWRKRWEYFYWAMMLKHTLRRANRILTVSESSKSQIQAFMKRHGIPTKEITVTYEPCTYEKVQQPDDTEKENYVIHLASCEPHKRTAHLIHWWHEAEMHGRVLPTLHLIGTVPPEVNHLLASTRTIVKRPFLEDRALMSAYLKARALILPSEIEGFGLPALEAYYLGTPVCFVKGTSVEEILMPAVQAGGFSLESPESLFAALDEVMAMTAGQVRTCGLVLRETYAARRVAARILTVFEDVGNEFSSFRCRAPRSYVPEPKNNPPAHQPTTPL